MLDAAEDAAGLRDGTLWLKWPNDIVADGPDGRLLKVAGVLGETALTGDGLDSAVVGIGVNGDWRARDFPPELAPADDQPVRAVRWPAHRARGAARRLAGAPGAALRGAARRHASMRAPGALASAPPAIASRSETGAELVAGIAGGVDPETGALLVEDRVAGRQRAIGSGEVVRCRIVELPVRRGTSA